ncbi:MAG: hypothetical protein HY899_01795 [Deltaproteobacteria bacterium]|nr:hypothetical protein [Deltaproteobacteria bacterium]
MLDANGQPLGDEFRIDVPRGGDSQQNRLSGPRVAANDDGFVVVWASIIGSDTNTFARHFTKQGAATSTDVVVSQLYLSHPDIGTTSSGFVVAGISEARRLDPLGAPAGVAFDITYGLDTDPAVVAHANDFHILWTTHAGFEPHSQPPGLRGRRFDLAGGALTDEFMLNSGDPPFDADGGSRRNAATSLGADRFVAVWTGETGDSLEGLWGRVFDAEGNPSGPVSAINVTGVGTQVHPDVAMLGDNHVAVVWDAGEVHGFVRTFDVVAPHCGDADENGTTSAGDALAARSCETSIAVGDHGLVFDFRGCAYGNTLFSCKTPSAGAATIAEHASINRCGGGRCGVHVHRRLPWDRREERGRYL